jgi:hypothetical protein
MCFSQRALHFGLLIKFKDALNRASVVPSRTSSPTQSVGTIPSQRSSGSAGSSGTWVSFDRLHSGGRGHARYGQYTIFPHPKLIPVCAHGQSISFKLFPLGLATSFCRRRLPPFTWPGVPFSRRRAHHHCAQQELFSSSYQLDDGSR